MYILKFAIEAIFKPSLVFLDKKNAIAAELWESQFTDWQTDGLSVNLKNPDEHEHGIMSHNRVTFIKDDLEAQVQVKKCIDKFSTIFDVYSKNTKRDQILRLGMRIIAIDNPELNFKELVESMQPKIYPSKDSKIFNLTAKDYEDVSYASVFKQKGASVRLQFGPVTKKETVERAQAAFIDLEELPETAIFYDIDCWENNIAVSSLGQKVKLFEEILIKVSGDISSYLLEEESK